MGQFWLILGRRASHLGPPDGRFSLILTFFGAPRRPIWVKIGTPTWPIFVDTGGRKCSISVKLEAVGGPISVYFGLPSQPLWAPGRPIFANLDNFWGAKTPDFRQTWNANMAHLV